MIVYQKAVVQTAQRESRKDRCEKFCVGERHKVTPEGMAHGSYGGFILKKKH